MTVIAVRALAILNTALKMEEEGKEFYERAMAECSGELARNMFSALVKEEDVHIERIKKIYASLTDNQEWTEEWRSVAVVHEDLGKLFRKMAAKQGKKIKAAKEELEAMDVGIDFEERSIKYYEDHLSKASAPQEKAFLERMVEEEKDHRTLLTDMKQFHSNPTAWFAELEHHSLDGA